MSATLAVALLACSLAAVVLDLGGSPGRRRVHLARAGLVLSLLFIAYVTLVARLGSTRESGLSLVPFVDTLRALDGETTSAVALAGIAGNVVLFVPVGVTLAVASGGRARSGRIVLTVAVIASSTVEVTQFAMDRGGVAALDDVVLNVSGAVLGWLAYSRIRRRTGRTSRARRRSRRSRRSVGGAAAG
ncbi:VanZ family protein [Actinophytocola gossypii]|uniref:VanZ family protein n=1 Tax=Actinophytocola gossypii TaxID=2812003 RepID=A0ABT2J4J1_9PSEU|nr:VanZ family protein [Actinophytocola gossypii]MCT2582773.1 VanZ family protein [Actinophytocola gossypii]